MCGRQQEKRCHLRWPKTDATSDGGVATAGPQLHYSPHSPHTHQAVEKLGFNTAVFNIIICTTGRILKAEQMRIGTASRNREARDLTDSCNVKIGELPSCENIEPAVQNDNQLWNLCLILT